MGFNYDRIKRKEEDGHTNWWTSYADLFMMLSVVFLLMYVSASLRSGAAGYMQQQEFNQLAKENHDLKEQIKVYDTLKDQQLQTKSEQEQQVYANLMDKLKLLQDEAHEEKESLQRQAQENAQKEQALNQYQQIVRNIINANMLAKAQIQHRDQVIQTQDQTISSQEKTIREKQQLIAQNEATIQKINAQLAEKIEQVKREQKRAHLSKKEMEKRIAKLRAESTGQIQLLEARSAQAEQELQAAKSNLAQTENKLGEAQQTIAVQEQEKGELAANLEKTRQGYLSQIQNLQAQHAAQLAAERDAFQKNLEKQNLSAAAKAKKLAEFAAQAEGKAKALEGELSGLKGKVAETEAKLAGTENKLAGAEREKGRYVAAVEGLKKQNAEIQSDLEKTRALANARKELAKNIENAFRRAGIKADVNPGTGEVTLDFGQEYFESGSAQLKPEMMKKLDQFFPIYAQSLFNNPKTAEKIGSVELIGFASSTYKGKYVNPTSLKPEDRDAVNYNLKLSFNRANEIFKHIYGRNSMSDDQKKKLLPMIKVVGRGYLPEGTKASEIPDGISEKKFCEMYSCKKAQKVIVKFNFKD